jgi:LmbE family N-acetylglucosaminyl deacetylase|tara:strand:+ start:3381 stop:4124 length:744 start_codon:yes stop_codon:yes gene_type:complete
MTQMLDENCVIPFYTSPLPEGPWLVFAPHADDETFGMGGSLLLARNQGIETHVVIVTDGALGGDGDRQSLINERAEEARRACIALGVKQLHFMEEPDRGLVVSQQTIAKAKALITNTKVASIFFPTVLEYHPDHRSTAELVWTARNELTEFEGQMYSYEITTQAPINLLIDTSDVALEKYSVVDLYATQLTQSKYLALTQAMDTARTFTLPLDITAAEGFFHYADTTVSLEEQLLTSVAHYFKKISD